MRSTLLLAVKPCQARFNVEIDCWNRLGSAHPCSPFHSLLQLQGICGGSSSLDKLARTKAFSAITLGFMWNLGISASLLIPFGPDYLLKIGQGEY
jgi:hypothetical protein